MNIEEKDLPTAIRRAAGRIVEFHACSNDRGTPGEDHQPWPEIAAALHDAGFEGPVVIEAFHPRDQGDRQGGLDLAAPRQKPGRARVRRAETPSISLCVGLSGR